MPFTLMLLFISLVSSFARAAVTLNIGDQAPALQVETWTHGGIKTGYQPGHLYIIDFWASWCGPCIDSLPHLSEIGVKHAGQNVHVVAVGARERTAEDYKNIAAFINERFPNSSVNFGHDSSGKAFVDWMEASGSQGIPNTFVVDGTGTILFIGHPAFLDSILPKILDGTWQSDGEMNTARQDRDQARIREGQVREINNRLVQAFKDKNWHAALTITGEGLKLAETSSEFLTSRLHALRELGSINEMFNQADAAFASNADAAYPLALFLTELYTRESAYASDLTPAQRLRRKTLGQKMVDVIRAAVPLDSKHGFAYFPPVAQFLFEEGSRAQAVNLLNTAIATVPEKYQSHFYPLLAPAMAEYTNDKFCLGELCALPPAKTKNINTDLVIGSLAPFLKDITWIQGTPLVGYQPGQVTVVEFWATWCGPCLKALPHLSALQKKWSNKLKVISLSDKSEHGDTQDAKIALIKDFISKQGLVLEQAVGFIEGDLPSEMIDANGGGIPSAYIIDQTGRIAYMGSPLDPGFERALEDIINEKWDLTAAIQQRADNLKKQADMDQLVSHLRSAINKKQWDEAITLIKTALIADPDGKPFFESSMLEVLVLSRRLETLVESAQSYLDDFKNDGMSLVFALEYMTQIPLSESPAVLTKIVDIYTQQVTELMSKFVEDDPEDGKAKFIYAQGVLAKYHVNRGNKRKARDLLRKGAETNLLHRGFLDLLSELEQSTSTVDQICADLFI